MDGVSLDELAAGELDLLRALWLSLFDHHRRVTPPILRAVSPEESWSRRRRLYLEWLSHADAFALVARLDANVVGYALVSIQTSGVLDDTWVSGERVAELQSLVVAAEGRGQGIGSTLMDAVEARLREIGIGDLLVGVVSTNARAIAFYQRRGMTMYLAYLYRRLET